MITAVIFDFDGTLAHLTIDFGLMKRRVAALAEAFLGRAPEENGAPVLEWLDELAAQVEEYEGRDMALEFHSRARLVINATELDAARQGGLFDFTLPLLGDLAARGVGLGVITRNSTAAVRTVFPDIARYCGAFVAREDARAVKPDPEHVFQALEILQRPAPQALVVGDHGMDIVAGKAAGCFTAGVLSGNMQAPALESFHPDYLEQDAAVLMRLLAGQGMLPRAGQG